MPLSLATRSTLRLRRPVLVEFTAAGQLVIRVLAADRRAELLRWPSSSKRMARSATVPSSNRPMKIP